MDDRILPVLKSIDATLKRLHTMENLLERLTVSNEELLKSNEVLAKSNVELEMMMTKAWQTYTQMVTAQAKQ